MPAIVNNPSFTIPNDNSCFLKDVDIELNWTHTGATYEEYDIYVDDTKINVDPILVNTYTIVGGLSQPIDENTSYTIKVVQFNEDTVYGDFYDTILVNIGHQQSQPILDEPNDGEIDILYDSVTLEWDYTGLGSYDGSIEFDLYFGESPDPGFRQTISTTQSIGEYSIVIGDQNISTTYYWKVVQKTCFSPTGTISDIFSFTTYSTSSQPSIFTLTYPNNLSIHRPITDITFTWNESIGQDTYDLYLGEIDSSFVKVGEDVETNSFNYLTPDLLIDTEYKWKVVQKNLIGSIESSIRTFKTRTCHNQPVQFNITSLLDGDVGVPQNVTIEWGDQREDPVLDKIERYEVYIGLTEETLVLERIVYTNEIRGFIFNASLLTTYYCYVKQINYCGDSSTDVISFTTAEFDVTPSVVLSSPTFDAIVGNNPLLKWVGNNAQYYKIYVSDSEVFSEEADVVEDEYTLSEIQVFGLDLNKVYFWKVIQYNTLGNMESSIGVFRVAKYTQVPSDLILINPTNYELSTINTPTFVWDQNHSELFDLICYVLQYDSIDCSYTLNQLFRINNINEMTYSMVQEMQFPITPCLNNESNFTHAWKIIQKNDIGEVESSVSYFRIIPCTSEPLPPILRTPIESMTKQMTLDFVTFEWMSSQGQISYDLYLWNDDTPHGEELIQEDIIGLIFNYDISNFDYGETYFWGVRQKNSCGVSEMSVVQTFNMSNCTDFPTRPTLKLPSNGTIDLPQNNVRLEWFESSLQIEYMIFLRRGLSYDWELVTTTSELSHTIVDDLLPNITYYWRVIQVGDCGNSDPSQISSFTTYSCTTFPENFSLISPSNYYDSISNVITIKWDNQDGQDFYDIYLSTTDSPFTKIQEVPSLITEYELRNLNQETLYSWKVIQRNVCGTVECDEIFWFTITSQECKLPTTPTNPYPLDGQYNVNRNIVLNWKKSMGNEPISYEIYFGEISNSLSLISQNEYDKQEINQYVKYGENGIEELVEKSILLSTYDVSNSKENLYKYPLFAHTTKIKYSCERYVYFKQENLSYGSKINNLKLYFDNTKYNKNFELYIKLKELYDTPERKQDLNKIKLQNLPINQNISVNGYTINSLTNVFNRTDYVVLQQKILPDIQHHNVKNGILKLQYDEYVPDVLTFSLQQNTTYYWRVTQINECGEVDGPTWSFTTGI